MRCGAGHIKVEIFSFLLMISLAVFGGLCYLTGIIILSLLSSQSLHHHLFKDIDNLVVNIPTGKICWTGLQSQIMQRRLVKQAYFFQQIGFNCHLII